MPVNEYGQPVGEALDWTPPPAPAPVRLVGRTVTLEPLAPAHGDHLWTALCLDSPASVWTYLFTGPYAPDQAGRAAFDRDLAARLADPTLVPMAVLVDGRPLGWECLMRADPAMGSIEVGHIALAAALQRTTAATEAAYLLMRHVFEDLGYRRYEWKCDALNEPSRGAAVRLGFRYEGRFRQAVVYKGRNRDTDWFAVTDADWPGLRAGFEAWLDPANFDESGRQRRPLALSSHGGTGVPSSETDDTLG